MPDYPLRPPVRPGGVRRPRLLPAPHQRPRRAPEARAAAGPAPGRDGGHALHDRPDARAPIAADPDLLLGFSQLLDPAWGRRSSRPSPRRPGPALQSVPPREDVQIGDLEDLEKAARAQRAELVIGNSHAVDSAERLGVPILRAGLPAVRPRSAAISAPSSATGARGSCCSTWRTCSPRTGITCHRSVSLRSIHRSGTTSRGRHYHASVEPCSADESVTTSAADGRPAPAGGLRHQRHRRSWTSTSARRPGSPSIASRPTAPTCST